MPSLDYFFTQTESIEGTSVSVDLGSSLTYNQLMNELQFQPYIFDDMSIFADSSSQVGQIVTKTKKTSGGEVYEEVESPKISPTQYQFVIDNIKLSFIPSPINSLKYKVKANQSVSLWFFYRHRELIDYRSKNIKIPSAINNKEIMKSQSKPTEKSIFINPIFSLVNKVGRQKKQNKTIKEIIGLDIKTRDVSNQEVITAFEDSDFIELP